MGGEGRQLLVLQLFLRGSSRAPLGLGVLPMAGMSQGVLRAAPGQRQLPPLFSIPVPTSASPPPSSSSSSFPSTCPFHAQQVCAQALGTR